MKQRAMAILIAATMVAAGLSVAPAATAGHNNCHRDFLIPDSEPLLPRTLQSGATEIGREDVTASGGNETLNVELTEAGDNGELTWTVYHKPAGTCIEYTDGGCDQNNVLDTEMTVDCTLVKPDSGSKNYWVVNEETGLQNAIDFKNWIS